jgi:hypothetical protein
LALHVPQTIVLEEHRVANFNRLAATEALRSSHAALLNDGGWAH